MTSQSGSETFAVEILSSISPSKGNQTMKRDQSIEYDKRNIFLQILYRKWSLETSSRPLYFSKKLSMRNNKGSAT